MGGGASDARNAVRLLSARKLLTIGSQQIIAVSAAERKEHMHQWIVWRALVICPLVWGACGATVPPPTQRMADAESAERSAREVGADNQPDAQLSLKLAQEQISQAKVAMARDDNARAASLLVRAKADAELAIAQSRETNARVAGQRAVKDADTQKATNVGQGAVK
jgi:hypothetical protein